VPRRTSGPALDAERGPVLVKPRTRTAWDNSSIRLQLFGGAGKARIFANGREARANALVAQLAAHLQFQEYVPGGDDAIWSFHGFAAPGGEVLASFVGRKIRTYPALTGDSSYLRLARLRSKHSVATSQPASARRHLQDGLQAPPRRPLRPVEINTLQPLHNLGAVSGVNLPKSHTGTSHARRSKRWLTESTIAGSAFGRIGEPTRRARSACRAGCLLLRAQDL
jgi:hypothetical protein